MFGREESGLLESELLLCSHACSIPSGRAQPSLNLSHAAAVVLSQLFDLKQQRLLQLEAGASAGGGGAGDELQLPGAVVEVQQLGAAAGGSLFEDGETAAWWPTARPYACICPCRMQLLRIICALGDCW